LQRVPGIDRPHTPDPETRGHPRADYNDPEIRVLGVAPVFLNSEPVAGVVVVVLALYYASKVATELWYFVVQVALVVRGEVTVLSGGGLHANRLPDIQPSVRTHLLVDSRLTSHPKVPAKDNILLAITLSGTPQSQPSDLHLLLN
jgi:hypothetical protein